ncbi:enoyl-CoA hydratase/isomerase family protein [Microbacterium aurum]
MPYGELSFDHDDAGIVTLRVGRPERRNAMGKAFFEELPEAVRAIRALAPRVVIVRGNADGSFSAGFDTAELEQLTRMTTREFVHYEDTASSGFAELRNLPCPTIAAIDGPAVGGGLALALACDIRLASEAAFFLAAFVKIGLSIGELGSSYGLTRAIGPGRAAELAFTARPLGAEESAAWGLVRSIHDDVHVAARELADQIVAHSPAGIHISKLALIHNQEIHSFAAARDLENRGQAILTATEDTREAIAAFAQQRAPRFRGA